MPHLRAIDPAERPASRRSAGFTLIEMVVTLAILVVVLLGVMALFDMASRISRVQVDVADVQQTLRAAQYDMVRMIRMAGRGSVPVQGPLPPGVPGPTDWVIPRGIAFGVDNNVAAGTFIDPGADTGLVLAGTDVITVRGVINTPVLNVVDNTFAFDEGAGPQFGRGTVQLTNQVKPGVPVPQSLRALDAAITNNVPEALILVSPLDDAFYHIVELDPGGSTVTSRDGDGNPTQMTIAFRASPGDGITARTANYWELSGNNWDSQLVPGSSPLIGIVEEYRYWIQDVRDDPDDATSAVSPRLVRSRFFPGTQVVHGGAANLAQPIAEHVTDLQVAMGIEWATTAGEPNSLAIDVSPFEPAEDGTEDDEWLYNHADDDDTLAGWRSGRLYYIRLSTTTVSPRIDRDYLGPANDSLEDHAYAVPDPGTPSALTPDRRHRRRTLRTMIDLRNL